MDYKLECPVCLEYFKTPKILPCGHTYCEYCLNSLIKDSEVSCPECNQHFKNILIERLPRNYILDKVIESHKNFDFELSNKLLNIELEEYPKKKEKKVRRVYENEEKKVEENKVNEKQQKIKNEGKGARRPVNIQFLDPNPQVPLIQQGDGIYMIANSRLFKNICKCTYATIVFLLILNGLTVFYI